MGTSKQSKTWPLWGFALLFVAKFLSSTVYGVFNTTLVGYALACFACGSTEAAWCVSVFTLGSLLSRPFAGYEADRFGVKPLLVIGFGLFFVTTVLAAFAPGFLLLAAIRFLQGVGFGVIHNTVTLAVAQIVSFGSLGREMGFFSIAATLSSAAGPFVGINLQQHFDSIVLFTVAGLFSFVALICILIAIKLPVGLSDRQENSPSSKKRSAVLNLASFFDVSVFGSGILALLCCVSYASITAFLNVYLTQGGMGQYASWYFLLYPVINIPLRPILGSLIDKGRTRFVIMATLFSLALGMFLLSVATNFAILAVSALLVIFGYGGAFFSLQTKAVKEASLERRGVAVSTMGFLSDLGMALGPLVMGILKEPIGYSATFAWCGLAVAAAAVIAMVVTRK